MGLRKDPETGNYILTAAKAVQRHRASRKKYTKHNLAARRAGLIDWLKNLFSFSGDPFRSSAIASHIGKQTRLVKTCKATRAAGIELDPSHFLALQVHGGLADHLADAETEADTNLDQLDVALNQEEAFLDECRPEKIKSDLDSELQKEIDGLESAFGPIARKAAEERIHLENFRATRQLPNTFHWGERFTTGNLLLLLGVVVFEFLLNASFFAGSNPLGLIGGASIAFLLSIVTVALGVGLGLAYQLNHRTAEGGGWHGKIMYVIVPLLALFYLMLLTLAREAGEAGELQMFKAAAQAVLVRPFSGLLDLPSLAYFVFSVAVIAYTAIKFVTIMGRFYGLRRRVLHAEDSELSYDAEVSGAGDHFRTVAEGQLEALDSLPLFIQDTLLPIKDIEMDFENVVDQHENDSHVIGSASKLLHSYMRSATGGTGIEVNAFAEGECEVSIAKHKQRLTDLRARVRGLVNRDGIQPATIDRCRKEMRDGLKAALEVLLLRTGEIKKSRYDEQLAQLSDNPTRI